MEWSTANIYNIINLYREFECLWDYRSPNYKRCDLKKHAWEEIARAMKTDVCGAKKKIKHLRTAYVCEKKKVENSKKSGSSVEMLHQPRLFYFSEMAFLDSVVALRQTTSSLSADCLEVATEAIDLDTTLSQESQEISFIECDVEPTNFTPLPLSSPAESSASSTNSSSRKLSTRRLRRDAKFDSAVDAIVASATQVETDNVFTSFGRTIAMQLQGLPLAIATQTMSEIQSHVTSKVLANINASQPAAQEPNILETALRNADIDFLC